MKAPSFSSAFVSLLLGFNLLGRAQDASSLTGTEPGRVTISATDPIGSEAGPSTGLLTVQRTGPTAEALTVLYKVSGSAIAAGDFHPLPGAVVIPAGAVRATIQVTPIDDLIAEEDETVVVTLLPTSALGASAPALPPYEIGRADSAAVLIRDNDLGFVTLPTVEIKATDSKAAEPRAPGRITISRIGESKEALNVLYQVVTESIPPPAASDVTSLVPPAAQGVDYESLPTVITIPAGRRSVTIAIQPLDDTLIEGREHVTLRLLSAPAYQINLPDRATVLIEDNDPVNLPPRVGIETPRSGASFAAPASILISAQASDSDGVVRSVEFFANGRSLGVGSPAATPANLFQLSWNDVGVGEYSLTTKATDNQGATTTSSSVKIKVTSPPPPVVTIEASQARVLESNPSQPGVFVVSRAGSREGKLKVRYLITGPARNGVDFQTLPGEVTISAGETSARILVVPIPDKALERSESVTLLLTRAEPPRRRSDQSPEDNYTVGSPRTATVVIYDELPNEEPTITLTSPQDGATFDQGIGIQLAAQAADADGQVKEVTFYANEQALGSVQQAPFVFLWNNAPAGRHVLFAKATDDRGESRTSSSIRITVAERIAGTRLIPANAVWKFRDQGTDEGTAWRAPSFNDGSWASGPGQLGYGDGDEATVVSFGPDADRKFITTYFRHAFLVPDASAISRLTLRLLRDDGAVVYLNGTEVLRSNMPDGAVEAGTLAAATVGDEAEAIYHVQAVDPKLLVNGLNVMAVEVHQRSVTSSDVSFDLELIGGSLPGPVTPGAATLVIEQPRDGTVLRSPANVLVVATAVDPKGYISRVEFLINGQFLVASQVSFVDAPAPGSPIQHSFDWRGVPLGRHVITAQARDTSGTLITSAPVTLTVEPSVTPATVRGQSLGGGRRISFPAEAGRAYSVQRSSDLVTWVEMGTVQSSGDAVEWIDPGSGTGDHGFYRAVPVENSAPARE